MIKKLLKIFFNVSRAIILDLEIFIIYYLNLKRMLDQVNPLVQTFRIAKDKFDKNNLMNVRLKLMNNKTKYAYN